MQLLVQASELIVLHQDQVVQLVDLLLSISCLTLVALEHRKEAVHTLIACLTQVLHNFLTHFNLLFVLFELGRDSLGVAYHVTQIFLLRYVSLLNLTNVLTTHVDSCLLEAALVLRLCNQCLLHIRSDLRVLSGTNKQAR